MIFLDEPTSGVDEASQESFYKLLRRLNREMGITLILVAHDIDVVTREVTEVAAINRTIVYYGGVKEFTDKERSKKFLSKDLEFIHHHHV